MNRLLMILRRRRRIDISEVFSKHEFSVVPHSLFDNKGKILKCDDKVSLLRGMEATALCDPVVIQPTTE